MFLPLVFLFPDISALSRFFCPFNEVAEHVKTDFLAFLRVELSGDNIVMPNRGCERFAISCSCGDDRLVNGFWEVTVDEIHITAGGDPAKQRAIRSDNIQLIPSDLWRFQAVLCAESDDTALENRESGGATVELFAALEEGLVPDAYSEKRPTALNEIATGSCKALSVHGVQAIVECADTGQNKSACAAKFFRARDQLDGSANVAQALEHALEVSGSVINQRNHSATLDTSQSKSNSAWRGRAPSVQRTLLSCWVIRLRRRRADQFNVNECFRSCVKHPIRR